MKIHIISFLRIQLNMMSKTIYLFDHNNLKYYLTKYLNFDVISDNKFLIENFLPEALII